MTQRWRHHCTATHTDIWSKKSIILKLDFNFPSLRDLLFIFVCVSRAALQLIYL